MPSLVPDTRPRLRATVTEVVEYTFIPSDYAGVDDPDGRPISSVEQAVHRDTFDLESGFTTADELGHVERTVLLEIVEVDA